MATKALYVTPGGSIRKTTSYPEVYTTGNPLLLKRGDRTALRVGFLDESSVLITANGPGDSPAEAAATFVQLGLKEVGKYDTSSFVASGSVVGIDGSGFYVVELDLNNSTLDALLVKDGDDSNDLDSVELMFEITWSITGGGSGATDWRSTNLIHAVIENDVIRTNEAAVTSSAKGLLWQWGFDAATAVPNLTPLILVDQTAEPFPTSGFSIDVTSATYSMTALQVAKSNSLLNTKVSYGTGQPADVTNVTATPTMVSGQAVHSWWDGAAWNLHIYDSAAWVAGWTSAETVATPAAVTTWVADTTTYSGMTDDLSAVTVSAAPTLGLIIPAAWNRHGQQTELLLNDSATRSVVLTREDTTFTLGGGTSLSALAGSSLRLGLNAESTIPNWQVLDYDEDFTGDIGWVA